MAPAGPAPQAQSQDSRCGRVPASSEGSTEKAQPIPTAWTFEDNNFPLAVEPGGLGLKLVEESLLTTTARYQGGQHCERPFRHVSDEAIAQTPVAADSTVEPSAVHNSGVAVIEAKLLDAVTAAQDWMCTVSKRFGGAINRCLRVDAGSNLDKKTASTPVIMAEVPVPTRNTTAHSADLGADIRANEGKQPTPTAAPLCQRGLPAAAKAVPGKAVEKPTPANEEAAQGKVETDEDQDKQKDAGDFYRDGTLDVGKHAAYCGAVGRRALQEEIRIHMDQIDVYIPPSCPSLARLIQASKRVDLMIKDVVPYIWNNLFGFLIYSGLKLVSPMAYQATLQNLLDVSGNAGSLLRLNSERRAFESDAKKLMNTMVRESTTHHIGGKALPAKGVFLKAARKYRPPTHEEIELEAAKGKDGNGTTSDHPYAAAARHLTVVSLRRLVTSQGLRQWDPSISSYHRDKDAHGARPVHTLKDLAHNDPDEELLPGDVVTYMDCCNYEKDLKLASGHHFIAWTSKYPHLSGRGKDSVYHYTSTTTVTEVVGHGDGAQYKEQIPWQFNQNDLFYLESVDGRSYSVYQVEVYYQPELLKQIVFGCCLYTVNIPYEVHNNMSLWANGHALDATGIGTIGPAENVKLCAADPALPYTRNVLVMQTGTVDKPTVSLKFEDDIGPECSVTITNKLYEYVRYIQNSGGRGQSLTEIQQALKLHMAENFGSKIPDTAIVVLASFMRASADFGELPNVVYLNLTQLAAPPREVKTASAVNAMPPITNGTNPGVLAKTDEAVEAYTEKRMKAFVNTTVPSQAFARTFEMVLGYYIKGVSDESKVEKESVRLPTFKEVEESRNAPMQVQRRENHGKNGIVATDDTARVETKKETAHKVGDAPRGVTSMPYVKGVDSGRLGKGCETFMKPCDHYNPGSTPQQIADRVRDVYTLGLEHETASEEYNERSSGTERRVSPDGGLYTQAQFEEFFGGLSEWEDAAVARKLKTSGVREKDFTKMDETHSEFTATVMRQLIKYFFHPDDVEEALAIYESLFNMLAKAGKEVLDSGWKNSSGSGITTVLNSLVNAVIEMVTTVVALCMMTRDVDDSTTAIAVASGDYELTTKEVRRCMGIIQSDERFTQLSTPGNMMQKAYRWVGPKFGDDALDPATPFVSDLRWSVASMYVQKNIGMLTKLGHVSCVQREPCEYLSRIHPNPLHTRVSYCKIEKACDKLRIAQQGDLAKFALKLHGYATTDLNSPIVGAYIKAAAKIYNVDLTRSDALVKDVAFMAKMYDNDRDMYFRLSNGPFPPCEDETAFLIRRDSVAREFGFTGPELTNYDTKLSEMSTREQVAGMRLPVNPNKAPQVDPPNVHRVAAASGATELAIPRARVSVSCVQQAWLGDEQ